jgi:hypothetical protein
MNVLQMNKVSSKRELRTINYVLNGRPSAALKAPRKKVLPESDVSRTSRIMNILTLTKCHGDNLPFSHYPLFMDIQFLFTPPKEIPAIYHHTYLNHFNMSPVNSNLLIKYIFDLFEEAECASCDKLILSSPSLVVKINSVKRWSDLDQTLITIQEIE